MASTKFKSSQFVVDSDVDYKGNQIKNAGFEVVSSLPTTNLFVGRKVCYSGKDYIYNGTAWTNDADALGGKNSTKYQLIRPQNFNYNNIAAAYFHPFAGVYKITLPLITNWTMLYMEISIRQKRQNSSSYGGKLIIQA